jgi:hypothetical protein
LAVVTIKLRLPRTSGRTIGDRASGVQGQEIQVSAPGNNGSPRSSVAAGIAGQTDLAMPAINSLWPKPFDAASLAHQRHFLNHRIGCRLQAQAYRKITQVKELGRNAT